MAVQAVVRPFVEEAEVAGEVHLVPLAGAVESFQLEDGTSALVAWGSHQLQDHWLETSVIPLTTTLQKYHHCLLRG